MTIYIGYPDYVQVMVEFENGLFITDAALHRSKIILEWVEANKGGKKTTHVVPSHHHRDHVGSVADYLAAGATLGIPEVAKDLYNFTGTVSSMATYSEDSPFVMKDKTVEFRSFWKKGNPHAEDWSFGVATRVDSSNSGDAVVFVADVINPGADYRWDSGVAREFLVQAATLAYLRLRSWSAHGSSRDGISTSETLAKIAGVAGFPYPLPRADAW